MKYFAIVSLLFAGCAPQASVTLIGDGVFSHDIAEVSPISPPPVPPKPEKPEEDKRIVITAYAPSWCWVCGVADRDEWKWSDRFRFDKLTDDTKYPQWVKDKKAYPVLAWDSKSSPTGRRFVVGWQGIKWFGDQYDAGEKAKAAGVPLAGLYASNMASRFTWPCDLRQHLASEHGIDTSGMTDAECIAYHDAAHSRRRRSGFFGFVWN